jgi:hypothetical protein
MKKKNVLRLKQLDREIVEKIQSGFLNEEFFARLLKLINSRENEGKQNLLDKILDFSRECYIHGVTTGISAALDIYKDIAK